MDAASLLGMMCCAYSDRCANVLHGTKEGLVGELTHKLDHMEHIKQCAIWLIGMEGASRGALVTIRLTLQGALADASQRNKRLP